MTKTVPPPTDPVTESMPADWLPEQKIIAKDAMRVLVKEYPGWLWQLEWTENVGGEMGMLIIRLGDVPTKVVYVIAYKDIDRDQMRCVRTGGGHLLESLELPRHKGHDQVHGLQRTEAGLIIPDLGAMIETNPGYSKLKKESLLKA